MQRWLARNEPGLQGVLYIRCFASATMHIPIVQAPSAALGTEQAQIALRVPVLCCDEGSCSLSLLFGNLPACTVLHSREQELQ